MRDDIKSKWRARVMRLSLAFFFGKFYAYRVMILTFFKSIK